MGRTDPAGAEAVGAAWLQQTKALGDASPAYVGEFVNAVANALGGIDDFFTAFGPAGAEEHLAVGPLVAGLRSLAQDEKAAQLTQRAAMREAKREVGIPTSQQAVSQTNGAVDGVIVGR